MRRILLITAAVGLFSTGVSQAGIIRGGSGQRTRCIGVCPRAAHISEARSFTLRQAHRAVRRFERDWFGTPAPTVAGCHWRHEHRIAACTVRLHAVIVTNTLPVTVAWTDRVARHPGWVIRSIRLRQIS